MSVHLSNALEGLKRDILRLASLVEDQVLRSVESQSTHNTALAQEVVNRDEMVDDIEVEIEERCLQVLALYQPVAKDLRYVVSILKINNDLERVGDAAVSIAERALFLSEHRLPIVPIEFQGLAARAREMLRKSIDAMIRYDAQLAREVCRADAEVDKIHAENYLRIEEAIVKYPTEAALFMQFMSISRSLERIADQATNIAEDVVYLVEGRIVRHDAATRGFTS
jgi:phosphate transport system protein